MPCVLRHGKVAVQATIVKKVDQHPPPQPEDIVHGEAAAAAHHPPHPVVLPLPHDDEMCSPPPGPSVICHTLSYRKKQCVLPDAKIAEQAVNAKKVDQTSPPGLVAPGLPAVCDELKVFNE